MTESFSQFSLGDPITSEQAMAYAVDLGKEGWGHVAPNPLVGCVVVSAQGRLLATGAHLKLGREHAEINALNQISDFSQLKDAWLYVTLEPCAHQGRTPSCAQKLATLPLKGVSIGVTDPHPKVSGQGVEVLKKAGLEVQFWPEYWKQKAKELAEIFHFNMENQAAFVAMKVASSLDGVVALASGESQWITAKPSRDHAHYLRAGYDAVCVGRTTLEADQPRLNIRHKDYPEKPNKAVIIDSLAQSVPEVLGAPVMEGRVPSDVVIALTDQSQAERVSKAGLSFVVCQKRPQRQDIDWRLLAKSLYQEHQITSLFVEGGARIYSSLLEQQALQRLYLFLAPTVLGSQNNLSWSQHHSLATLKSRQNFRFSETRQFGEDILWSGYLPWE